jgi:hypothetical protein
MATFEPQSAQYNCFNGLVDDLVISTSVRTRILRVDGAFNSSAAEAGEYDVRWIASLFTVFAGGGVFFRQCA